ncbi:hypothetical protein [Pedomonas sp. V897]|uniref:hypothetical protein n=1 Tax=Pedomonas sp. V897 TaxID=3446482 RepID=UPI003EE0F0E5
MTRDSDQRQNAPPHPLAGQAEQKRRRTESRQLEAKAGARASLQGEETAVQNQVGEHRPGRPPNADQAPRTADSGTLRPARGEVRAAPDEEKTRYQSAQSRRGE